MSERLDQHWRADLTGFDSVKRCFEIRIEAPHETDLEHQAALLCGGDHLVAFGESQSHRLLTQDVLSMIGRQQCKVLVREGWRGDHDGVELASGKSFFERSEAVANLKSAAG